MTNREKRLQKRKRNYKWSQIGMIGVRKCPICDGTNTIQIYRYDAWACRDCNEWLEEKCGDLTCPYCKDRPETPDEAYWRSDLSTGSAYERKCGGETIIIIKKLVSFAGIESSAILSEGFYMSREEILEKRRAENRNKDIYEQEVVEQASTSAVIVMAVLATIFFAVQIFVGGGANWGMGHLFSAQA